MSRDAARTDFEEFVAVCSSRLLRTAYLLTGDERAAERLLDDALARAWLAWKRLDEPPEPFVRRQLVARARGAHRRDDADGAWGRLHRLSSRQRAVIVLHLFDGLSLDEAAEVLGCSPGAARTLAHRALEHLAAGPATTSRPAQPHGAP